MLFDVIGLCEWLRIEIIRTGRLEFSMPENISRPDLGFKSGTSSGRLILPTNYESESKILFCMPELRQPTR